ncbi:MAG: electron transfer flavoprotein subunit alpha/FixB family protein [Acidobacteriota bacterium]
MDSILVLIEHRAGRAKAISLEALSLGQKLSDELGKPLKAVVIGKESDALAAAASVQAPEVLVAAADEFADYTPETYCHVLSEIVRRQSPYLLLMGHTYQAIDFAPRLAATLDRGFIPNCIDCRCEAGRPLFFRQVFAGKLTLQVGCKGEPPYLASVQQGAFGGQEVTSVQGAKVLRLDVPMPVQLVRRKVLEVFREAEGKVDLSQADIIVAGGRGLGNKEKFQIVLDLAKALGAAVGASRPVTDGGWLPKEHQIGSSGQTVSPKLYIACGISGAIQHTVGMVNSGCIVAINKDPNAPIFSIADYAIVGDVFKVVPVLTELAQEIRK